MRLEDEAAEAMPADAVRTERSALIGGGALSLLLAVVGSVTSLSVVGTGSADGARYLTVNIGLGVLGAALLLTAWRRRRREMDSVTDALA
jgi:MYXO-CTERM domain-containing protein